MPTLQTCKTLPFIRMFDEDDRIHILSASSQQGSMSNSCNSCSSWFYSREDHDHYRQDIAKRYHNNCGMWQPFVHKKQRKSIMGTTFMAQYSGSQCLLVKAPPVASKSHLLKSKSHFTTHLSHTDTRGQRLLVVIVFLVFLSLFI